jgi:hypothetical protein
MKLPIERQFHSKDGLAIPLRWERTNGLLDQKLRTKAMIQVLEHHQYQGKLLEPFVAGLLFAY